MQDKSFLQAIQDLQDRISDNFYESVQHMLLHRTSAVDATLSIEDEKMRTIITNALIVAQIITLLALMRDLHFLGETQYKEFRSYLLQAFAAQHREFLI
ncbi:MAG: hypothetical protein IMW89_05940 [Ktedonobacteraceae bacterium]|nr:hypothetical protein [Ktedonobacteraceae bacterium]